MDRPARGEQVGAGEGATPLLFLLIYLIWGFTYVATKIALRDAAPLTLAGLRAALGALVLVAAAWAMRRVWPRGGAVQAFAAVVGLLNVTGLAGAMSLGLTFVGAGEAALLVYTQPLQVALLSALLLRERLARRQVAGLVVGFAGMAIVLLPAVTPGQTVLSWGHPILLAGAFTWALSAVLFRLVRGSRRLPVPPDVVWLTALQAAYGAVPLLLGGVLLESFRLEPTLDLLWTVLFTGLLAAGVANLLWFHLLSGRTATVVASYVFLVPVFAVVFGWLVLGEPLSPTLLGGGVLTLAGIALVTRAA